MSKVMALAGAGVGGAALAVGGSYMLGAFGSGDGITLPKQLQQFKQKGSKYCVSDYFPGLDLNKGTSAKLENSFFTTATDPAPTKKSCLIVNWDRKKYETEDKWEGDFRWLWTFLQGDTGFVMFTVAEAKKETSSQLDLNGGIYFVKKNKTSNVWEVDKYQELPNGQSKKQISKTDFDTKFPSVGEGITEKDKFFENKDHWEFVSAKDDFDKVCVSSDKCDEKKLKSKEKFRGIWEWENGVTPQKKITDWGKNWNTWFSNMYGTDAVDFSTFFDNIQGKWTNKQLIKS